MKNTRKGFTLVELVIVIAVIAILAAVLIPTFGGIIEKANESAAQQAARNAYSAYLSEFDYVADETGPKEDGWIKVEDYYVQIEDGVAIQTRVDATGKKCEAEGCTHANDKLTYRVAALPTGVTALNE